MRSDVFGLRVEEPEEVQFNPEELRLVEAVSPTVQAERNEEGVLITVHDLNGTRTAQLFDGIASIAKTGTAGLIDTYTITWKDGTTSTFEITNGKEIATIRKTAASGLTDTYTITYTDGSTDTLQVVNGRGITGATLNSDYTLTLAYNDGTHVTVGPIRGERGEKSETGLQGIQGETGPQGIPGIPGSDYVLTAADKAEIAGIAVPAGRVETLDTTPLESGILVEAIGMPVYVSDITQYSAWQLTETGWYIFARIRAKDGITVSGETSVAGAAGVISTIGAAYIDAAVRFEVAALSKKIVVTWAAGNAETFIFKSTDLAVRNLDYRTTFYVYDISDYVTWTYALTTDTTFVTGSRYFTESGGEYTEAVEGTDWTAGGTIPANTYYKHSKLTLAGMIRNVTYRLNEMVDCPVEISVPAVPDDGYGAWFEIQLQMNEAYSVTLVPADNTIKVGATTTQSITAGINVIDLTYSAVNGVKLWTLLNTHTNIPTS